MNKEDTLEDIAKSLRRIAAALERESR